MSRSTASSATWTSASGSGLAALYQIGNQADHLRFYGGRYGILTENTTPYWPFTLLDSVFDGQRDAAIREHLAGLTVDPHDVPQRAHGHRDRPRLLRSAVGEGQPLRERLARGGGHLQREERADAGRLRERACAPTCRCSRASARAAETEAGAGPTYRVTAFNYGSSYLPPAGRGASTRRTGPKSWRNCRRPAARDSRPAADGALGERAYARREGRRRDRRHRRHPQGHRVASRPLLPDGLLHRHRHASRSSPTPSMIALHPARRSSTSRLDAGLSRAWVRRRRCSRRPRAGPTSSAASGSTRAASTRAPSPRCGCLASRR